MISNYSQPVSLTSHNIYINIASAATTVDS